MHWERGPRRVEAPAIAARLSAESGADVGRVALRVRNRSNVARGWSREALLGFERSIAAGASAATLESYAESGGVRRYARAIGTEPMCTLCHGDQIAPEIAAAIRRSYPADRAVGFRPGDLRGAIVVTWKAPRGASGP